MSAWLEACIARADDNTAGQSWLAAKRQESLELLRESPWPTRKTEAWKYTPLRVLQGFSGGAVGSAAVVDKIDDLNSIDLVFVDGNFDTEQLSVELPEGLSVTRLADADRATQAWAAKRFACIKPERHLFGLVNDVLFSDGVIIDVAAGCTIHQPIRVVQQLSEGAEAHTRVLVRLGEGAKAAVIEQCDGNSESFNTLVAEYQISAKAELEHYRFAFQVDKAMSVGGCHFDLAERAQLNSTLVGFGSTLSRVDVDIHHGGEHTFAKFNAIYLLDGRELFDLHATVEHANPNGRTIENIRCIIADHAKAVFNGRIHIHRDAQKVLAELNNRNLLLSDHAEINTKPELEIYADDVKCAHGATIAAMDEQALYYLQSRGVDRSKAQVMLSFGFINELVDQMPNQILAEWLRPQLRQRFSQMEVS